MDIGDFNYNLYISIMDFFHSILLMHRIWCFVCNRQCYSIHYIYISIDHLNNFYDAQKFQELMRKIHETPPKIRWNMECYHLKETERDNGEEIIKETVVVNTWKGTKYFKFSKWNDISKSWNQVCNDKIIKLEFDVAFQFANSKTERMYYKEMKKFMNHSL